MISVRFSLQGSSLSSGTKSRWLHQFHIIASGLSAGIVPLASKNWKAPLDKALCLSQASSSSSAPASSSSSAFPPPDWPSVRILYPTEAQANAGVGQCKGSFPGLPKHVEEGGYRALMHKTISQRHPNVLIHAKVILALPPGKRFASGGGRRLDEPSPPAQQDKGKSKAEKPIGWLYMGSHNFTIHAWGSLGGDFEKPTVSIHSLAYCCCTN